MTGSNVMGKASVVSSEKGGLVLGAGLSDAGPYWHVYCTITRYTVVAAFGPMAPRAPVEIRTAWPARSLAC